jgi:hypothetical protein
MDRMEPIFVRKFITFAKQTNLYLNHFPKHEKYGLCAYIREDMYKVFDLMIEGQKRYHKKTTLSELDICHERLRAKLLLAYHLGYFGFKDGKTDGDNPLTIAEKRYANISFLCDEIGKLIGGWIKKIKEENRW